MAERSKTVKETIARLYATMAEAAAKKALRRIDCDDAAGADIWALKAIKWMDMSSADAIRWRYSNPRVL